MSTRVRNLVIAMIMGMLLALGTTAFGQIADDYEYYKRLIALLHSHFSS